MCLSSYGKNHTVFWANPVSPGAVLAKSSASVNHIPLQVPHFSVINYFSLETQLCGFFSSFFLHCQLSVLFYLQTPISIISWGNVLFYCLSVSIYFLKLLLDKCWIPDSWIPVWFLTFSRSRLFCSMFWEIASILSCTCLPEVPFIGHLVLCP